MLLSSTGIQIQAVLFSSAAYSTQSSCSSSSSSSSSPKSRESRRFVGVARARSRSSTFYDLLELPPDVGISDIKQAYRQLARRYHPDVCPASKAHECTRRFIEIQEAYDTLSDPRRRAVYDHAMTMARASPSSVKMPWRSSDSDSQPSDWRVQWESQLAGLRQRSSIKAQRADSWSAQMRKRNGTKLDKSPKG